MIRALRLAAGLIPLLAGAGARAADGGLLPAECTAYLTVQRQDCVVEHHYTCPSVPGHRWRIDYDVSHEALFLSEIDAEAGWVSSRDLLPGGYRTRMLPNPPDGPSLSTLLETGEDHYVFDETSGDGVTRIEGFDRLTGETAEIDGEPLLRTVYGYRIYSSSGDVLVEADGHEFVSARHRRFFSGTRTWHTREGDQTRNSAPVEFVYPGEPGFLSATPLYGCGGLLSALVQREEHA